MVEFIFFHYVIGVEQGLVGGEIKFSGYFTVGGQGSGVPDDEVDVVYIFQVIPEHGKNRQSELIIDDVDSAVSAGF